MIIRFSLRYCAILKKSSTNKEKFNIDKSKYGVIMSAYRGVQNLKPEKDNFIMKKSLNAWTVDDTYDFEKTFAAVKGAGFDGIELNVDAVGRSAHSITMETTDEELLEIRALSEKYGLPVVSISTSLTNGGNCAPEYWDEYRALIRKQLLAAKLLGAKGILTAPADSRGSATLAKARKSTVDFYKEMKDEIEKTGLIVGLENVWNGLFTSPFDMISVIDEIGSPNVKAYFDAGNMIAFSCSEHWAEALAGYIAFVHVKDYHRNGGINSGGVWKEITEGDANWEKIIREIKKGGFDGYVTGEVSGKTPDMTNEEYYARVAGNIAEIISY